MERGSWLCKTLKTKEKKCQNIAELWKTQPWQNYNFQLHKTLTCVDKDLNCKNYHKIKQEKVCRCI